MFCLEGVGATPAGRPVDNTTIAGINYELWRDDGMVRRPTGQAGRYCHSRALSSRHGTLAIQQFLQYLMQHELLSPSDTSRAVRSWEMNSSEEPAPPGSTSYRSPACRKHWVTSLRDTARDLVASGSSRRRSKNCAFKKGIRATAEAAKTMWKAHMLLPSMRPLTR